MASSGFKGLLRWLLLGWKQAAFSVLAVYAVAAVIFLVLGGASPESSMDAMEEQIIADSAAGGSGSGDGGTGGSGAGGSGGSAGSDGGGSAGADGGSGGGSADFVDLAGRCDEIDPTGGTTLAGTGGSLADGNTTGTNSTGTNSSGQGVHSVVFNTLDGDAADLSAYAGCPLLINFFASWCVPCVTEMPDFDEFWKLHGSQVAVIGLAVEAVEPARAIVEETGVTYLTGVDEDDLFIELGGLGMPTTVFVSATGELLNSHSGILTFDDLITRSNDHFGLDNYFDDFAS